MGLLMAGGGLYLMLASPFPLPADTAQLSGEAQMILTRIEEFFGLLLTCIGIATFAIGVSIHSVSDRDRKENTRAQIPQETLRT